MKEIEKHDIPTAVTIKPVLKMFSSYIGGDIHMFKDAALEIARELELNGKYELSSYILAQYDMVRTFSTLEIPALPERKCHCIGVDFGTYDNTVVMVHPTRGPVTIDTCIATEIGFLWRQGIDTLNSCCGHGKQTSSVIVSEDSLQGMDKLGYIAGFKAPSGLRAFYLHTGTDFKKIN